MIYHSFLVLERFEGDLRTFEEKMPMKNLAAKVYEPLLQKVKSMHTIKYKDDLGFTRIMVHADLAPKNILYKSLKQEENLTICLTDFGMDIYDKDIETRVRFLATLLQYMWAPLPGGNDFHFPRKEDFPEIEDARTFWDPQEGVNLFNKCIESIDPLLDYKDLLMCVKGILAKHEVRMDSNEACKNLIKKCIENPRILDYFYLQTLKDAKNGIKKDVSDTYVADLLKMSSGRT